MSVWVRPPTLLANPDVSGIMRCLRSTGRRINLRRLNFDNLVRGVCTEQRHNIPLSHDGCLDRCGFQCSARSLTCPKRKGRKIKPDDHDPLLILLWVKSFSVKFE
ncbi:hypothetical protein Mapa_016551 [Marchantia paleacea]|nr:hypothetical protein Mapa_016551 [Marchantia paleacea]